MPARSTDSVCVLRNSAALAANGVNVSSRPARAARAFLVIRVCLEIISSRSFRGFLLPVYQGDVVNPDVTGANSPGASDAGWGCGMKPFAGCGPSPLHAKSPCICARDLEGAAPSAPIGVKIRAIVLFLLTMVGTSVLFVESCLVVRDWPRMRPPSPARRRELLVLASTRPSGTATTRYGCTRFSCSR